MLLITYVFSVAFMTFARGTSLEKTHFSSMGDSVMALIMKGILPDQAGKETSNTSEAMLMFH